MRSLERIASLIRRCIGLLAALVVLAACSGDSLSASDAELAILESWKTLRDVGVNAPDEIQIEEVHEASGYEEGLAWCVRIRADGFDDLEDEEPSLGDWWIVSEREGDLQAGPTAFHSLPYHWETACGLPLNAFGWTGVRND